MSGKLYGIMRAVLTLIVLALAGIVFIARADDAPKPAANNTNAADDYLKATAPGPEHEKLKDFVGEWDADVKTFNPDGTPSGNSKGVMHAKMILGDRFLQLNYDGEMNMPSGKVPFHGMGIGGYDNGKKKYVSLWIDELSTGVMSTEGTMEGDTLTCEGTATEPMSGQPMKVKEISKQIDKDHHSYELWMAGADGKMMKAIEIMYTRKA